MNNMEIQDAEMDCLLCSFAASDPSVSLNYIRKKRRGKFSINPSLRCKMYLPKINTALRTRNDFLRFDGGAEYYEVTYLPPLYLNFCLPLEYPGCPPNTFGPDFFLTSDWLPKSLLHNLHDQLNQVVAENSGEPVLWLLVEAVQTGLSTVFMETWRNPGKTYVDLQRFYEHHRWEMPLPYAAYYDFLVSHNDDRLDMEFQRGFWDCSICAETLRGIHFFRFPKCRHRFCKDCVRQSFKLAIDEGLMSSRIACLECNEDAGQCEVRSLLPDDWYTRYLGLTLKRGLSLMRDVATCPRPGCEAVVILDDETLGRCPQCELSFCPFCLKTYHGTVRCPAMPNREPEDLLSLEELERLRKEEAETERFLKNETRSCPGCYAPCMKIYGCNKMTCVYCGAYFCWVCGNQISNHNNPYVHFGSGDCGGRLFENITL